MPGDMFALQQGDGVLDRGGRAGYGGDLSGGFRGGGQGGGAEPAAFDNADYRLGVGVQNGRAALAAFDGVAKQEESRSGGGFLELGGFVGENGAWGAIFARGFQALRVLQVDGMERKREDGLAGSGGLGGEGQVGDAIVASEGVGRDAEDGDVVPGVGGDDGGWQEARRSVWPAHD